MALKGIRDAALYLIGMTCREMGSF